MVHSAHAGGLAAWAVNILFKDASLPSQARLWSLPRLPAPRARLAVRLHDFVTNCHE
jgi:hypothetical protein